MTSIFNTYTPCRGPKKGLTIPEDNAEIEMAEHGNYGQTMNFCAGS